MLTPPKSPFTSLIGLTLYYSAKTSLLFYRNLEKETPTKYDFIRTVQHLKKYILLFEKYPLDLKENPLVFHNRRMAF